MRTTPHLMRVGCLLVLLATRVVEGGDLPGRPPGDTDQLTNAIHLAAGYLIRACGSDGMFVYRVNLNPEIKPEPRYNMLRHAGAMVALAMVEQRWPSPRTRDALVRAGHYLTQTSLAPIPEGEDLLAIWSYPERTGTEGRARAKLGGTGLGLVALISLERIVPGQTSLDQLRRMGRFLIFMQKPDGSFYSRYIPEKGGRSDEWVSLYYPGEAALGLLMLYERDPSGPWLDAAEKALLYLARSRQGKPSVEADHWALLATARRVSLRNEWSQPDSRQAILQHAVQICESMLAARPAHPSDPDHHGCFTEDGRTCPTAIRLEGLLAALEFLPSEQEDLRERMTRAVDDGVLFLQRSQIASGEFSGGVPRAIGPLPERHAAYGESFNRRVTEIRIDYVQHALSAMIQADEMRRVSSDE